MELLSTMYHNSQRYLQCWSFRSVPFFAIIDVKQGQQGSLFTLPCILVFHKPLEFIFPHYWDYIVKLFPILIIGAFFPIVLPSLLHNAFSILPVLCLPTSPTSSWKSSSSDFIYVFPLLDLQHCFVMYLPTWLLCQTVSPLRSDTVSY